MMKADVHDPFGVRDGTFFIIDATEPMFTNKTKEGISYFNYCIKEYINILKQKLTWDHEDWIGLAFIGTEKCDTDTKYIQTFQKLSQVKVDYLKKSLGIYEKEWKLYEISTAHNYPLHDALWLAVRALSEVKVAMTSRRVIFLTCQDVPPWTDDKEKHRIRCRAKNFTGYGMKLHVIGLGDNWNADLFYKDLEILSKNADGEDYKKTIIKDVINQVKRPSRIMSSIPWRIGGNLVVDVSVRSLLVKTCSLKSCRISKETNLPLETHTHYRKTDLSDDEDEEDEEARPYDELRNHVLPVEMEKAQTYGDRIMSFTLADVQSLTHFSKPGIDLIGFKPITCDPSYHLEAPKFVTCGKSLCKDNALMFAALVQKCDSKKIMAICSLTLRTDSPSNLFCMIPYLQKGGFYLYRIAFQDDLRDAHEQLSQYMFNDEHNKPPINEEAIEVARKMIRTMVIDYDGNQFPNPSLEIHQQNIETLALELEQREPPIDKTVPEDEIIQEKAGDFIQQFMNILNCTNEEITQPPAKKPKLTNEVMDQYVKSKEVESLTILRLKEFLKSVGCKIGGTKPDLVQRVYEYYSK